MQLIGREFGRGLPGGRRARVGSGDCVCLASISMVRPQCPVLVILREPVDPRDAVLSIACAEPVCSMSCEPRRERTTRSAQSGHMALRQVI